MKIGMLQSILIPTVLYGSKSWMLNVKERKMVEALDKSYLRKVFGVGRMHRIAYWIYNKEIWE